VLVIHLIYQLVEIKKSELGPNTWEIIKKQKTTLQTAAKHMV
jgi:hypothetical protein